MIARPLPASKPHAPPPPCDLSPTVRLIVLPIFLHHGNHCNDPLSSAVFTTKLCFKALSLITKRWMQGHTFATTPGLAPGLTYPLLSTLPIPQPFSSSSLIPPCSYLSPPAPRFPTNSGVPHPDPSTLWLLEKTAKQYRTISNMPQNITSKWKTTLMFWN